MYIITSGAEVIQKAIKEGYSGSVEKVIAVTFKRRSDLERSVLIGKKPQVMYRFRGVDHIPHQYISGGEILNFNDYRDTSFLIIGEFTSTYKIDGKYQSRDGRQKHFLVLPLNKDGSSVLIDQPMIFEETFYSCYEYYRLTDKVLGQIKDFFNNNDLEQVWLKVSVFTC